ncbi:MAG: DMP19 family protein [Prevotella sp.]
MKEIIIKDDILQHAAEEGMDAFVDVFTNAILDSIDGQLTAENMSQLNSDQITLLAFHYLHEEVMDGGFVQLIHNGLGAFIYMNPTDKAFREWGIQELFKIINKSHRLYAKYHEDIEKDCSDEDFMAMFEQYAEFDDFDDEFVENEEMFVAKVAHYIDEHIDNFAKMEK